MAKEKTSSEEVAAASAPITDQDVSKIREETGRLLALQPKRKIKLRKELDPKAPNYETVQINGYTYTIMKGVDVEVPEEVYNILDRAGLY
jgi:hypothetical protein